MPNVFIKPATGPDGKPVRVPDPDFAFKQPLRTEGAWKERDDYWSRRLRDHDVVEATPPAEDKPASPPAETKSAASSRKRVIDTGEE